MAYWENYVQESLLDQLTNSSVGAFTGNILLGLSGFGGLAKTAWNVWDLFNASKKQQIELEKQNELRRRAEQARTERLARMREKNYARHAAYSQQTEYGVSMINHASVASGLSIYSGEAQHNRMQFVRNRARLQYSVLLGEA